MNYLLFVVGAGLFIWGLLQNKKMQKNFKNVYEEAIHNHLEEEQISFKDEKYNIIEMLKRKPVLIMGIGIGILLANFVFMAYRGLGYNDYEIEKMARKLGMKYEDEMLVRYEDKE
ncbi:MAG: hypothetical protein WC996_01830 [Peptostreptococcales bacterium]